MVVVVAVAVVGFVTFAFALVVRVDRAGSGWESLDTVARELL